MDKYIHFPIGSLKFYSELYRIILCYISRIENIAIDSYLIYQELKIKSLSDIISNLPKYKKLFVDSGGFYVNPNIQKNKKIISNLIEIQNSLNPDLAVNFDYVIFKYLNVPYQKLVKLNICSIKNFLENSSAKIKLAAIQARNSDHSVEKYFKAVAKMEGVDGLAIPMWAESNKKIIEFIKNNSLNDSYHIHAMGNPIYVFFKTDTKILDSCDFDPRVLLQYFKT